MAFAHMENENTYAYTRGSLTKFLGKFIFSECNRFRFRFEEQDTDVKIELSVENT